MEWALNIIFLIKIYFVIQINCHEEICLSIYLFPYIFIRM